MFSCEEAKGIIEKAGIRQNVVASVICVNGSYLNEYLLGKRLLDHQVLIRLNNYLVKVQEFLRSIETV